MKNLFLLVLLALTFHIGGLAAAKPSRLLREIRTTSASLIYMSETDSPVSVVLLGRVEAVDEKSFRKAAYIEDYENVSIRTVDEFFYPQISRDANWGSLHYLLVSNLQNLTVFQVGEIWITYYVVGVTASGNVIGIRTNAVETLRR